MEYYQSKRWLGPTVRSFSERVILKLRSETIQSQSCDDQFRQREVPTYGQRCKGGDWFGMFGKLKDNL